MTSLSSGERERERERRRMTTTIESILEKIRLGRQRNPIALNACQVCRGLGRKRRVEGDGSLFCSSRCNKTEFHYSELFQLGGMKRTLGTDAVKKKGFADLPSEIQAMIILMTYDYRLESLDDWRLLDALREFHFEGYPGEGAQLKWMINNEVIPNLIFVHDTILIQLSMKEISRFKSLTEILVPFRDTWEGRIRGKEPLPSSGNWTGTLVSMKSLRSLNLIRKSRFRKNMIEIELEKVTQIKVLKTEALTNEEVVHLQLLEELSPMANSSVTLDGIASLSRLTSLSLHYQCALDGEMIQTLTNLQKLSVINNFNVEDEHILALTNLRSLESSGTRITMNGLIGKHVKLETLIVPGMKNLNDEILGKFLLLTTLDISFNHAVTDDCLSRLTNLRELVLDSVFRADFPMVSTSLQKLTNLTSLSLAANYVVRDEDIESLFNLTSLNIQSNLRITDRALRNLSSLTFLKITKNRSITLSGMDRQMRSYGKLKTLHLDTTQSQLKGMIVLTEVFKGLNLVVDL